MTDYDALVQEWYRNANQMAALFANHNPYFESRETRNMLLNHLDLTRRRLSIVSMGNTNRALMYSAMWNSRRLRWQIILQEDCWQDKTYRLKSSDKCNSTDHSFVKADRTVAEKPHAVESAFKPHGGTVEMHRGFPAD